MPLFDFICRDCDREQEILIRGSETPTCQACGSVAMAKLLSVPVAHVPGGAPGPGPGGRPPGSCGSGCGCH